MISSIHLGFECSTGLDVSIPLHHLVCTGLTQCSGKTTTLEALVSRSGFRSIVFATKRGERDFASAREILPFFREPSGEHYWQHVQSLLEATLQESNKFIRPWVIKVAQGVRSLEEAHDRVKIALASARGVSEGVYTQLDAYFKLIIPEIQRARFSKELILRQGVNLMDLGDLTPEVQALVIQSVIDEIRLNYQRTIVVVPEAWKFVPKGRGSPVKASAREYIRQGAVLQNFLWIDSQDCVSLDTQILKSIDVWLLGRQRERNEIKRTLDQIPLQAAKPKPEMIANLQLGQFVACFGDQVRVTQVQPSWMNWATAQALATGKLSMERAMEKIKGRRRGA